MIKEEYIDNKLCDKRKNEKVICIGFRFVNKLHKTEKGALGC